jgi:hypothetical protein
VSSRPRTQHPRRGSSGFVRIVFALIAHRRDFAREDVSRPGDLIRGMLDPNC